MRLLAASLMVLSAGCIHVHVSSTATPRGGAGLHPGDRVVARTRSELREATVITVDGSLVTVAWDIATPDRSQLPRSWIVRLDDHAVRSVRAGDWRLCPADDLWVPCLAERSGQGLALRYADGTNRTLALAESLPVPTGLIAWTRTHAQRRLDHVAIEPTPPAVVDINSLAPRAAGRPVSLGDRVIAHWSGGGWWEAIVTQVSPTQVTVSWADGSAATPLPPVEVAPLTADPLASGDLGLCRWTNTQWWPARITTTSSNLLHIIYSDGTPYDVPPHECVAASSPLTSI